MVTAIVPHVGGPVGPMGAPTILIGFLPAARATDMAVCVGPPDTILLGEPTVLFGGLPAARMGDKTAHGGVITLGCPTVLIGSSAQAATLSAATEVGTPFCEKCAEAAAKAAAGEK
jgi:uncharacterized Zn-binding protein involved in type VI secretion